MRVSKHYKLGLTQPALDFVDVDVRNDVRVFIDPRALLQVPSPWADQCVTLVQDFFQRVLDLIKQGNAEQGHRLLGQLREPNETHLGLSRGRSKGHGLGSESSLDVWNALAGSQAAQSGLLEDLEDTVLLIPGIRYDIISDITTNIIRAPLIAYTQESCRYYGIPLIPDTASGPMWDSSNGQWYDSYVKLPEAYGKKLLLVPKIIVRQRLEYRPDEYYNDYVLEYLRDAELNNPGSDLIQVLKSGQRRVTKRSLKEKYGVGKRVSQRWTEDHPELLDWYRRDKRQGGDPPLTHAQLAEEVGAGRVDLDQLLATVRKTPGGKAHADKYHRAIEALLTALFYPSLTNPRREFPIHQGRKRIDIQYTNVAHSGFFDWVANNYPAAYVIVECKNYTRKLGNPEFDQIAGRFGPRRGKLGFLTYRAFEDKDRYWETCIDTAREDRGFIIPLDDEDLARLVDERIQSPDSPRFGYLHSLFERLINS